MLCSVSMLHDLGMNTVGKNVWTEYEAEFIFALLMVYMAKEKGKLDHTGSTMLHDMANPLNSTDAMQITSVKLDCFPGMKVNIFIAL